MLILCNNQGTEKVNKVNISIFFIEEVMFYYRKYELAKIRYDIDNHAPNYPPFPTLYDLPIDFTFILSYVNKNISKFMMIYIT